MVFPATDKIHKMVTMKNPVDFKDLCHKKGAVHLYMILLMSQTHLIECFEELRNISDIQISDKEEN